jgi:hypothetical protein
VDGDDAGEAIVLFDMAGEGGEAARGLSGFGGRNVALISPIPKKSSVC